MYIKLLYQPHFGWYMLLDGVVVVVVVVVVFVIVVVVLVSENCKESGTGKRKYWPIAALWVAVYQVVAALVITSIRSALSGSSSSSYSSSSS